MHTSLSLSLPSFPSSLTLSLSLFLSPFPSRSSRFVGPARARALQLIKPARNLYRHYTLFCVQKPRLRRTMRTLLSARRQMRREVDFAQLDVVIDS